MTDAYEITCAKYEAIVWMMDELALLLEEGDDAAIAAHRERIYQFPIGVATRSGWVSPGEKHKPEEFMITLAEEALDCQIVGELDEDGEPVIAEIEYWDWSIPRTRLRSTDEVVLLSFCREFFKGA